MSELCLFRWYTTRRLQPNLSLELEALLAEAVEACPLPGRLSLIRFGVGEDSAEFLLRGAEADVIAMMADVRDTLSRSNSTASAGASLLSARFEIMPFAAFAS